MAMFKECADIKTADMLNLLVPEATFHNVAVKPTEHQKDMIADLSVRAKAIHQRKVDSKDDNMLCVTNDGRKIGLDQRLMNPLLPDEPGTKVNVCVNNVFDIWEKTAADKSAQLVFCDFSTPKNFIDFASCRLLNVPDYKLCPTTTAVKYHRHRATVV